MRVTNIACLGPAGKRLLDQIGAVLDPLAEQYRGVDPLAVRAVLARSWRSAFHAELHEPALSRAATAITIGAPWQLALWTNEWP